MNGHQVEPYGGNLVDLVVDPYEAPERAEVNIDTTDMTPQEADQADLFGAVHLFIRAWST